MSITLGQYANRERDPEVIPLKKPTAAEKAATQSVSTQAYNEKINRATDAYNAEMKGIGNRYQGQQKISDSEHEEALRRQEQQRANSKREAYIAHERLQKYLPQVQALSGTDGLGLSETAKVNALNAYLSRRSAADAAYSSGVSELEAAKQVSDAEREMARSEEERITLQDYLNTKQAAADELTAERKAEAEKIKSEAEANRVTESAAVYELIDSKLGSKIMGSSDGKISLADYQEIEDFAQEHWNELTDTDQKLAKLTLDSYKTEYVRSDAEQKAIDKMGFIDREVKLSGGSSAWEGISNYSDDGNNFTVVDQYGNSYKVELDVKNGAVTDDLVLDAAARTDKGDIFGYGGKLYLNNGGTEVYAIRSQGGNDQDDWDALYSLFFKGDTREGSIIDSNKVQNLSAYASDRAPMRKSSNSIATAALEKYR